MKRFSRLFLLPVMVLLIVLLATGVSAAQQPAELEVSYPQRFTQVEVGSGPVISTYMTEGFESYLLDQFANCKTVIPVSQFEIPVRNNMTLQIKEQIWYEMPEAFNVYGLKVENDGTNLYKLHVEYYPFADTVAEYKECMGAIAEAAEILTEGVLDRNDLTDVELALLLHDRLATWVQYDFEHPDMESMPDTDFCMYGALGQQVAVCQGYTMAYMYLLDMVGIESDYCSSEHMCHSWNIVYIDGKGYHVDVTWDDPGCNLSGVAHENFLRSTQGIMETGHHGDDFNTTPSDTTYDAYFWQDITMPFVLLDSGIYFLKFDEAVVYRAEGTQITEVVCIDDDWPSRNGATWLNQERIAGIGNMILYSQRDGIYAYDVDTGAHALVFAPDLSESEYLLVYDFKYEKGDLICQLADSGDEQFMTINRHAHEYFALSDETYTVTFQDYDGTVLSSKTYSYGQVPVQPYVRDYEDDDGYIECWDQPVTVCRGNVVYRKTTRMTDRYRVEYRDWDETLLHVAWYDLGEYLEHPVMELEREEDDRHTYVFGQWNSPSQFCTGNMVIYAEYAYSYKEYKVSFVDWDGSSIAWELCFYDAPITFDYDNMEYLRTLCVRPDDEMFSYRFVDWDKKVDPYCHGEVTYTAVYEATLLPGNQNLNGWVKLDGKWYYYKNNVKQTGWLQIGSTRYYLDASGVMVTGDVMIDGIHHQFNASGAWLGSNHSFTHYTSDNNATCDNDGTKTAQCDYGACNATNTVTDVNSKLGHSFTDYVSDNNATYDADGTKTAKCDRCDATNTVTDPGTKLQSRNGWVLESGKWYYYKNNAKQTGWVQDGKIWYYMNSSGVMQTGWINVGGTWYYMNTSGAMHTGWLQQGSTWYYMNSSGAMVTGTVTISGKQHKFNASGVWLGEVQQSGWVQDGSTWYYYKNGAKVTGWLQVGGTWYYFKSSGAMATGWQQIGGTWYYFQSGGAMVTGWLKLGNTWYYFYSTGAMATGNVTIGGKVYRFNASGACLNP